MVAFAAKAPTWQGRVELGGFVAVCAATLVAVAGVGLVAGDEGERFDGAVVVSGALPASVVGASIVVPVGGVGVRVGDMRLVAGGDIVVDGRLVQRAASSLELVAGRDLIIRGSEPSRV